MLFRERAIILGKYVKMKQERKVEKTEVDKLLAKGISGPIPTNVKPMLATLVNEPFDDPGWAYEVKWDGYRSLAYVEEGNVELLSRNNKSFTEKYYPISAVMKEWAIDVVLDGELLVIKENGQADFGALQNWRSEADGHLIYYAFDILWYNGVNVMHLPLFERQDILKAIIPTDDDRIRVSQVFSSGGLDFFAAAEKLSLEGIMAKRLSSTYMPDNRSKDWLKIKVSQRQEVVIGGFTRNEGSSKLFSSLLLGVYENDKFEYVGKVGTGFTAKQQKEMMETFKPLIVDKSPYGYEPDINKPSRFRPNPPKATATWLAPQLVCEVSFAEVTSDGVFRHPSFEGLRPDKTAAEVVRETATDTRKVVDDKQASSGNETSIVTAPKDIRKQTLLNPTEETQVKNIHGRDIKFTNLSKVYWPEEGYTKRNVFNYYYQMAEYILPYLKDRPQSLNRFPNGIYGESFYQKNVKGKAPEWIKRFPYTTSDGENKEFLVGDDEATLLWMVSLGCIEMNPWFSRTQHPDNPDYCVIDLDPDKNTFEQVIQAAQEVKKILDVLEIPGFPKTSGSTGIHIYIPLAAKYSYDQSQMFGKIIATIVHNHLPEFTSIERYIKNRGGKMYVDYLQNRPGATIAGPYSLRPKPGATVSMPLHWDEVKKGLSMKDFTIKNAVERVRAEGDLFKGAIQEGINMEKALATAEKMFFK